MFQSVETADDIDLHRMWKIKKSQLKKICDPEWVSQQDLDANEDWVFNCNNETPKENKSKFMDFLAVYMAIGEIIEISGGDIKFKGTEGAYLNHMNLMKILFDNYTSNKAFKMAVVVLIAGIGNLYGDKAMKVMYKIAVTKMKMLLGSDYERASAGVQPECQIDMQDFWNTIQKNGDSPWHTQFIKLNRIENAEIDLCGVERTVNIVSLV